MVCLLTLAGCSAPQLPGSDAGQATMLSVAFAKGGSYRYHLHLTLDGSANIVPGPDQTIEDDSTADVTWRVASVDASGNTTVDLMFGNVRSTVTGSLQSDVAATANATTGSQPSTIKVAPSGLIVSGAGTLHPSPGTSAPGVDQFLAVLPDHRVVPGDTWTTSVTLPGPPGLPATNFSTNSRFVRYDDLKTGRAAVVESRAVLPIDMTAEVGPGSGVPVRQHGAYTIDSTTWLDTRTHAIERTRSVQTSDVTTSISGAAAARSRYHLTQQFDLLP
jgi:hypothetical protein